MIYRILAAPPGYPPHQNCMVAAYETLGYDSCVGNVRGADGSIFSATLEDARGLLPQREAASFRARTPVP